MQWQQKRLRLLPLLSNHWNSEHLLVAHVALLLFVCTTISSFEIRHPHRHLQLLSSLLAMSDSRSASPNPMEDWEQDSPQQQQAPSEAPRRRRQQQQYGPPAQQQQGALQPLGGVGGVTNTAGQAGQLLGNTLGQVTGQEAGGGKKSDTLKLRLDLNLEVDVQIKARIHGDVTLSLLG